MALTLAMRLQVPWLRLRQFSSSISAPAGTTRALVADLRGEDVWALHTQADVLARDAAARYTALVAASEISALAPERVRIMRQLEPIARRVRSVDAAHADVADVRAMAAEVGAPAELVEMAREEEVALIVRLHEAAADLVAALLDLEVPEDDCVATDGGDYSTTKDAKRESALLEIRAGAGGDEASLFANELLSMYYKYASRKGWRSKILSLSETNVGGCREVVVRMEGQGVYTRLRFEAGVHRVQRVPQTEASGRVHTSTAAIAVLRDDASSSREIKLDERDIKMDVFRASGAGGQHVNTTESAVRLTHVPTGLIAQSQEDRSQHRNRVIAMEALVARVAARAVAEAAAAKSAERAKQLGNSLGERSDRIRTYNYPQQRVTDHRIVTDPAIVRLVPSAGDGSADKNAALDAVLEGTVELDRIIDGVQRQAQLRRLLHLVGLAQIKREQQGDLRRDGAGQAKSRKTRPHGHKHNQSC
jgi:peptide chain release factor 1